MSGSFLMTLSIFHLIQSLVSLVSAKEKGPQWKTSFSTRIYFIQMHTSQKDLYTNVMICSVSNHKQKQKRSVTNKTPL